MLPLLLALSHVAHAQETPETEPLPEPLPEATSTAEETFGHLLVDLRQAVTWSAYADFAVVLPADGPVTFDASHFNPILGAQVSKQLWAELELEIEHAGKVVKVEYGFLDWRAGPAFTLRTGSFLVPFGAFNDRLHPSFRWPQVSRPAMVVDVVPAVWSDVGIQAMGDIDLASAWTASWSLYAINGLGGTWAAGEQPPLRDLRDNVLDNNADKGLGARLGATALVGASRVRLDLSGYTGALDDDGATRLNLADVALDAELGPAVLRGEAAVSSLGSQLWRTGLYAQAGVRVGRVEPTLRWDLTRDLQGDSAVELGGVASAKVTLTPMWNVRAEVSVDLDDPLAARPEVGAMSAFFF